MRIVCDAMPSTCQECCLYNHKEFAFGTCKILNRNFNSAYAITSRLKQCPLIGFDELFNYKFGKESAVNGEREGTTES